MVTPNFTFQSLFSFKVLNQADKQQTPIKALPNFILN